MNFSNIELEILTPEEQLFKGEVRTIHVPGSKGSFTILRNHAPIISTLESGKVSVLTQDYEERSFDIAGGIVEVTRNKIIILADKMPVTS